MAKLGFYTATWTNSLGDTIDIGIVEPFIMNGIDGMDTPDAEIQTKRAPFQDGTTFTDALLKQRFMNLRFSIFGDDNSQIEMFRSELFKKFSPTLKEGTLTINSDSQSLSIPCVARKVIAGNRKKSRTECFQDIMIPLVASDPAFLDEEFTEITLAAFTGGFQFPFAFPISFGTVGQSTTIDNIGHMETPVIIEMAGALTNPVFTNDTTGQSIDLTGGGGLTLLAGETLIINTDKFSPSIIKMSGGVPTNAYEFLTSDSELWQLALGENDVSYVAASQTGAASVTLKFKLRYVGM